jgi:hypothetical protein
VANSAQTEAAKRNGGGELGGSGNQSNLLTIYTCSYGRSVKTIPLMACRKEGKKKNGTQTSRLDVEVPQGFSATPFSLDVLEIIFDNLDPNGHLPSGSIDFDHSIHGQPDGTFFASLCLVSRLWLGPARRILYRVIRHLEQCPVSLKKLHSTIKGNPTVRPFVRYLKTTLDENYGMMLEIMGLLPSCSFSLHWAFGCKASITNGDIPLASVTYLRLSDSEAWTKRDWAVALTQLCRLESLYLPDPKDVFSVYIASQDVHQFLPSLSRLAFSDMWKSFVIPPTCPNTLHTLIMAHCSASPCEPLLHLIQRHSASLRRISFYLESYDEIDYDLIEVASYARGLQYIFCDSAESPNLILLPPSLIEASFCFVDEVLGAFVEASGSLRLLECEIYDDSDYEGWELVQNLCQTREIEFRCSCWDVGSGDFVEIPDWVDIY